MDIEKQYRRLLALSFKRDWFKRGLPIVGIEFEKPIIIINIERLRSFEKIELKYPKDYHTKIVNWLCEIIREKIPELKKSEIHFRYCNKPDGYYSYNVIL